MITIAAFALIVAGSCESLTSMKLQGATVTVAESVAAGAFTPPGAASQAAAFKGAPGFCRVAATLRPSDDSEIKIEVWLPEAGWNRKFMAVGNGAWAGSIPYAQLVAGLRRGYAT